MSIEGKVALVTGASRGIGAAIADLLGEQGAVVIGTATTVAGADKISQRFAGAGVKGAGMALDVAEPQAIEDLLAAVVENFGPVQVLVNNAGITRDNLLLRMKDDEWFDVINTNLNAVYRLVKACAKGMTRARWGRIISIGSVVGSMGNPGQSNYCATKAGVAGMSRALAKELGSRNITVNTVAPGFIDTDMTKELPEANKELMLQQIPLGRLGNPREVAEVVGFLAGDAGGYITGETIQVNGGLYMA